MRRLRILSLALLALGLLIPVSAHAAPATAVGIRIGDHPSFVRVVVDVTGTGLASGPLQATDPDPFGDGRMRMALTGLRLGGPTLHAQGAGVVATITRRTGGSTLRVRAAARRFRYAGYTVLHAPERVVVDLYRSAPPRPGATVRYGRPGCLTLDTVSVRAGAVRVTGGERDVFEHSFALRLRTPSGAIAGTQPVAAAAGRWAATVRHRLRRPRTGTVEAVELSAKDGSLSCLVERRVRLRP
jgi:hypothetical protein